MKRVLFLIFVSVIMFSSCSQTEPTAIKNYSPSSPALLSDNAVEELPSLTSAYSVFPNDIEIREYTTDFSKVYYPFFSREDLDSALLGHIEEYFSVKKSSAYYEVYDFCITKREGSISFVFYDSTSASASLLHRFSLTLTSDYSTVLSITDFIVAHDPLEHIQKTVETLYGGAGAFHTGMLPEFFVDSDGIVVIDALGNQFLIPDENFHSRPSRVVTTGKLYEPVIDTSEKVIALTFDDGPNYKTTLNLLKMLEEKGAKATFFVVGYNIPGNEFLLRRMLTLGCDVGIHSYAHQNFDLMSYDDIMADIDKCADLIRTATGVDPHLVRPPFGNIPEEITAEREYFYVNWCVDPYDWDSDSPEEIANHIIKYSSSGSIVLLHDLYERSCLAAEMVIDKLSEDGWRFVTVTELFDLKGERPSGEIYHGLGK